MKKKRIRYGEPTPSRSIAAVPAPLRTLTPAWSVVSIPAPTAAESISRTAGAAKASPRTLRERVGARAGHANVLMFRVAHEHFAVELGAVEEVLDLPAVHFVPEMAETMLGVITVRGSLTALYSPRRALGLPSAPGDAALVFRRERSRVALSIDDVDDVLVLDLSALRDAPDPLDRALVLGVARHGDGLLALLDADALLGACGAVPLQETA